MIEENKNGLSLRTIHIWLITIMVILSATVLIATFRLTGTFLRLAEAGDTHAKLEKAAHELMDASDYLTEQVQRFTLDGERTFMDRYFTEAFESNRREEAIARMDVDENTSAALVNLQQALAHSLKLMDLEYYSMRLVIEAKGITDYPDVLRSVELTAEDAALAPEEKMRRAAEVVLDEEYYTQKDEIRREMRESLEEVDRLLELSSEKQLAVLRRELSFVRIVIVVMVLSTLFLLRLTSVLGIRPVLTAVDRIKADSPIPEEGANEFRYLAQAYNRMYDRYRNSLENLNFKASHDELTGAYNRAGYELLLSGIDLSSTYMMLIDVDNFKTINDTYGHETGDRALVKLVQVLDRIFRDDDCICRIGGDEFVVFMMHSSGMPMRLIEAKIDQINHEMENTGDGLPPITISVGIVNGREVTDTEHLFEKVDAALYESKKRGKHTYTFYESGFEKNMREPEAGQ